MAHHKRRRPKHQRMACHCKYWKDERNAKRSKDMMKAADFRRLQDSVSTRSGRRRPMCRSTKSSPTASAGSR